MGITRKWVERALKDCDGAGTVDLYAENLAELCRHWLATKPTGKARNASEPQTWRPIETAPKDGRLILGYSDYSKSCSVVFPRGGLWAVAETHDSAIFGDQPTHWMPLPDPPQP